MELVLQVEVLRLGGYMCVPNHLLLRENLAFIGSLLLVRHYARGRVMA